MTHTTKKSGSDQPVRADCHGITDAGENPAAGVDQFLIAELKRSLVMHQSSIETEGVGSDVGETQGQILLVTDSMAGRANADAASRLAARKAVHYALNAMPWFLRAGPEQRKRLQEELRGLLEHCRDGPGTPALEESPREPVEAALTLAYVRWPELHVVHEGNGRCYLSRGERLERLTTDRRLARKLAGVDPGAAESARGELDEALWEAIGGGDAQAQPESCTVELEIGDVLLLGSDGLVVPLTDDEIATSLRRRETAEATARTLVDLARSRGVREDRTAVVARFDNVEQEVARRPVSARSVATAAALPRVARGRPASPGTPAAPAGGLSADPASADATARSERRELLGVV